MLGGCGADRRATTRASGSGASTRRSRPSGKVSGGGSRPYGYEADKVTVRPAEAAIVAECAERFLGGRVAALDRGRPERARGARPSTGGEWSPQTLAADARPRPGSAASASTTARSSPTAEWPAIITPSETAQIRAMLADPERRTNKAARRYLLARPARLQPLRRAAGRAAARGRPAPLRLREGRRASPAAARPTSPPTRSSGSSSRPCCTGSTRPSSRAAVERQHDRPGHRSAGTSSSKPTRRSSRSSPTAYGEQRDHDGASGARPREPIEQRLTAARKQLAQGHPLAACSTAYVGNGDRAARRLGRARPRASSTRSSPPSLDHVVVGPAGRGYNRFDESRLDARSGGPERAAPRPSRSSSGSLTLTGTPCSAQVRSTQATRAGLELAQSHCAQQAGGPCHPSTSDERQTRSGAAAHVARRPARSRPRPTRRSTAILLRLEALRDLVAMQPRRAGARPRDPVPHVLAR